MTKTYKVPEAKIEELRKGIDSIQKNEINTVKIFSLLKSAKR